MKYSGGKKCGLEINCDTGEISCPLTEEQAEIAALIREACGDE
jgi:hypothetical protein